MNTPNRLWAIIAQRSEGEKPIVYGTGQDAEAGLKRLRDNWPKDEFKLVSYVREGRTA